MKIFLSACYKNHVKPDTTTPSAVLDMFSLAMSPFSSKVVAPRPEADLHGKYSDSADIFGAGMEELPSRVSTRACSHLGQGQRSNTCRG